MKTVWLYGDCMKTLWRLCVKNLMNSSKVISYTEPQCIALCLNCKFTSYTEHQYVAPCSNCYPCFACIFDVNYSLQGFNCWYLAFVPALIILLDGRAGRTGQNRLQLFYDLFMVMIMIMIIIIIIIITIVMVFVIFVVIIILISNVIMIIMALVIALHPSIIWQVLRRI